MPRKLTLVDRVLIDRHQNPDRTSHDIAEALGALRNSVSTSLWTLRNSKMIDEENRLTDAGRAAVERLTAESNAAAEQRVDSFAPVRRTRAAKAAKPRKTKPAPTTPLPAMPPTPLPINRMEAAHRVADSVIANARTSQIVLRNYLDETVEVTPLLASLLDQCAAALTLIEQTYYVAARPSAHG